jgi:hypothetical protein
MPTARITYHELPQRARAAIEDVTGRVASATSAGGGLNSAVAARLRTATGDHFCKALPADHRCVWTQRREADIAPHLDGLAPDLIARLEVDGWDILLFEALDGHHADYSPGSPDLPAVVALLEAIAATPCPAIDLRDTGERLLNYVSDSTDLRYFAGSALLHTDLNSANIIVEAGGARIVDWGWATRGAAWLDPAYWTLWLISAGHHPAAAEQWADKLTMWSTASDAGLRAFTEAQAALWTEISGRVPNDRWSSRLAEASQRWMAYRRSL